MTQFEDIAEQFQSADPSLRLEILLEYADRLPELRPEYHALRDAGLNMVHECQSPVFMAVDVNDGIVRLHADVPREAPTARGFTSVLLEAFDGGDPSEVRAAPEDGLYALGLDKLLGMQRTRGLSAIYRRVKMEVARKDAEDRRGG